MECMQVVGILIFSLKFVYDFVCASLTPDQIKDNRDLKFDTYTLRDFF